MTDTLADLKFGISSAYRAKMNWLADRIRDAIDNVSEGERPGCAAGVLAWLAACAIRDGSPSVEARQQYLDELVAYMTETIREEKPQDLLQ